MPTQPYLEVPGVWRLVVRSHDSVNPTKLWTNTWAIWRPGDLLVPDLTDPIFSHIVDFHAFCLYAPSRVQDLLLYPWQYGRAPGGPTPPVAVLTADILGEIPATNTSPAWQGGGATGANVVIHLKLGRASGARNGKHFFRGGLQKADITSTGAGEPWTLSNAGGTYHIDTVINTEAATLFSDVIAGGPGSGGNWLGLVHTHKSGGVITSATPGYVTGISFAAVAGLQRRRRSGV